MKLTIPYVKSILNSRRLVANKKISKNNYIYAREKNGEWIKSDGISNKYDKVLLKTSWANENIIDDNDEASDEADDDETEILTRMKTVMMNPMKKRIK